MTEFLGRALEAINNPPRPATPAEARPGGKRAFPNLPCTDGCAGDLGHEGDCGPSPLALAYAQGRVHQTQLGDRWVHVTAFARRATDEKITDAQGWQRLYARMLKEPAHVFGGPVASGGASA